MTGRFSRFLRDERGANAVEFALVAAPFLLLLFGAMEVGRLGWSAHAINQVAIATARCVALPQNECRGAAGADLTRAEAFARQGARQWFVTLVPHEVVIEADTVCRGIALAGFAQVTIRHRFESPVPGLASTFGGGEELSASACFPRQI